MTTTNLPSYEEMNAMTLEELSALYRAAVPPFPEQETTARVQDYADGIYFVSRRDLDFFLNDDGNPLSEDRDYPDEGTAMKVESVFYEMDGDLYEQAVADAPSNAKFLIIRTGEAETEVGNEDGEVVDTNYYRQSDEQLFQLKKGQLIAL